MNTESLESIKDSIVKKIAIAEDLSTISVNGVDYVRLNEGEIESVVNLYSKNIIYEELYEVEGQTFMKASVYEAFKVLATSFKERTFWNPLNPKE